MNKLDLIKNYCLFEMWDENNTKIVEHIRFPSIPFISLINLEEVKDDLLNGEKCLLENPLKDFYIKIKDIDTVKKITDKDIISFYEKESLGGNNKFKVIKSYKTIKIKSYSELLDFEYTIFEFSYNSDDTLIRVSFDKDLKLKDILPLIFLDVNYYTHTTDPCF